LLDNPKIIERLGLLSQPLVSHETKNSQHILLGVPED
jgi:hypothetical protein